MREIGEAAYSKATEALKGIEQSKSNRTVIAYSVKNSGYQTSATVTDQLGATFVEDYVVDCNDDGAAGISLVFANYYGSQIGDNDINVKVGVKIRGVFYPIFLNGKRATTIEPGGDIESDILGVSVSKNEIIRVQTLVTVPKLGDKIPRGLGTITYSAGVDDLTMTDVTANTTDTGYSPIMIRGHVKSGTKKPIVSVWGASSFSGTGDTTYGFGLRALVGSHSFYRLAKGSEFLSDITYPRLALAKYSDVALVYVGSNDVYRGTPLEEMKASLTSFFTYLRNMGLKVYACTINGRTTSTDSWATVENQTRAGTSYAAGGIWEQTNAWLLTIPEPLHGVFDVWRAVESSPGSGKWKPYLTRDGIHSTPYGYALMASVIRKGIDWFEKDERMTTPFFFDYPANAFDSFDGRDDKYYIAFAESGQAWVSKTIDGWGTTSDGKVIANSTVQDYTVVDSKLSDCTVETDITVGTAMKAGHSLRFNVKLEDGYCWRINSTSGGQIVFSKRNGATATVLSTVNTSLTVGQTYKFKSVLLGNSIKVYKDNELVIDYTIPTEDQTDKFLKGTLHGLFSNVDTTSMFDNFKVY